MVINILHERFTNIFSRDSGDTESSRYKKLFSLLEEININEEYISQLKKKIKERKKGLHWRYVAIQGLYRLFESKGKIKKFKRGLMNVVLFTGIQGAGKTTTVPKYAKYFSMKKHGGYKVGVIAADTFRAGAIDQLVGNTDVVGIDCYCDEKELDPLKIIIDGLEYFKDKKDIVIVDTSGKNYQDKAIFNELSEIKKYLSKRYRGRLRTIFVADGTNGAVLFDQVKMFRRYVGINELVITKIDGIGSNNIRAGCIMSISSHTNIPISFVCNGEHINVKYLVKYDGRGFVEEVTGFVDINKTYKIGKKLEKGTNTLQDLVIICEKINSSMRTLKPMMAMFTREMKMPDGTDMFEMFGKFLVICKSLSRGELNDPDFREYLREDSRLRRIALGSGTSIAMVKKMILSYKMISNLGRSGFLSNMMKKAKGMTGNEGMMNMMNNMMSGGGMTDMMQNMMSGGGMTDMMQNMMSGGGMTDMMQNMMGGGMMDMMQNMSRDPNRKERRKRYKK